MQITRDEALLHLEKWLSESTTLFAFMTTIGSGAQCVLTGHITSLGESLTVSHPKGNQEAYLVCPWDQIISYNYIELRKTFEELTAYPGAADFMRGRSNLILNLQGGMSVLLTDLSPSGQA